jgi:paraquat-inducible protein B
MAKEANKTLIGAFVVGAVALVAVSILLFGGGRFLKKSTSYVAYFDGSVKGLGVGSKVQLKGVTVGQVKDVRLLFNPEKLSFINRVLIETEPGKASTYSEIAGEITTGEIPTDPEEFVFQLINRGLRAKLELESFVTGKLLVALDFFPESSARLRGIEPKLKEIPTVPTEFEKIAKALSELPLEELVFQINDAIKGLNMLIYSPELKQAIQALNQTLKNAETLMANIDRQVDPIASNLNETIKDYAKLARNVDTHVGPLATSITETARDTQQLVRNVDSQLDDVLGSTQAALEQAKKALVPIKGFASEDSPFRYNLTQTLQELTEASRAVRELAEYLERHPESLLRGKSASGER